MPDSSYKTSIKTLLASLASLDREEGPVELRCLWFDDLYFPADKRPERYKPDVWDRGLRQWMACFTDDELAVLGEFHNVFEAKSSTLPMDWPDWDKDPKWVAVRDAARVALSKLAALDSKTE